MSAEDLGKRLLGEVEEEGLDEVSFFFNISTIFNMCHVYLHIDISITPVVMFFCGI